MIPLLGLLFKKNGKFPLPSKNFRDVRVLYQLLPSLHCFFNDNSSAASIDTAACIEAHVMFKGKLSL